MRAKIRWDQLGLILIVSISLLRFILAAKVGLGDDEAYYWEWSRHLQLSYYDHPAMVSWLIKAGTFLFGTNSFGVRVFGLVANTLSGWLLWKIGNELYGRKAAWAAALLYFCAPLFNIGGILMVPDAPMGLAWVLFAYLLWRILIGGHRDLLSWMAIGSVLGFGFLSKYTMVLIAFSAICLMLSERDWRKLFATKGFWLACAIAAALSLPIVIWNAGLGWPTLAYHLRDRQMGGGGANFNRWGQFWVSQAIALGPALLILSLWVWASSLFRWRDRSSRFVLLLSLPTFFLFAAQSLFAEFKPHWPAPAYVLVFLSAGAWLASGFASEARVLHIYFVRSVLALIVAVFLPLNVLFYVSAFYPVLPKLARQIAPQAGWDPKFDPTNDLFGWPEAFARASELRREFVARGEPAPFLSTSRYQLVAQLAFVSGERVWRVSPGHDQYSFWQTADELKALTGASSIYITDNRFERDPRNDAAFASCQETKPMRFERDGEIAHLFHFWICRGYKPSL